MDFVEIDGSHGEGGGQILRSALALSAVTGRAFRVDRIRARRARPGLRPQHLAAVRAAALCCDAEVHGAFEGSPDLRFVPREAVAGDFDFDIGTAGATTLVLQAVAPILAASTGPARVAIAGGTHVPLAPTYHFLARHWAPVVERLGLLVAPRLVRAGFAPKGEGRLEAATRPWTRPTALDLSTRGRLAAVKGIAGQGRLQTEVARRSADAARALLWEARRLESEWEVVDLPATSPGAFLQVEAEFENGRAAFPILGERGLRAEIMGERAARRLLRFLGDEEAAVDPLLADQLAVPLGVARGGGRVVTSEVSAHLETVAAVLRQFDVPAETWGRRGGPGGLEVGRW